MSNLEKLKAAYDHAKATDDRELMLQISYMMENELNKYCLEEIK